MLVFGEYVGYIRESLGVVSRADFQLAFQSYVALKLRKDRAMKLLGLELGLHFKLGLGLRLGLGARA